MIHLTHEAGRAWCSLFPMPSGEKHWTNRVHLVTCQRCLSAVRNAVEGRIAELNRREQIAEDG